MKVSKYDHARFAVGKETQNSETVSGFMYSHPDNGSIDLETRLNNKNINMNGLYNVFNPVQAGTAPTEPIREKFNNVDIYEKRQKNYEVKKRNYKRREKCEKLVAPANKLVKTILVEETRNGENRVVSRRFRENDEIRVKMGETQEGLLKLEGINVEEFVSVTLRKSLRRHKKGAVVFLKYLTNNSIEEGEWKVIEGFLDCIRADYNKLNAKVYGISDSADKHISKHISGIKRSISNQNMIVQPDNDRDNIRMDLPIPSKEGKRTEHKEEEKKAANAFLYEYANLDENVRIGYLRRLRRLIDLYFSTPADSSEYCDYVIPAAVDITEFNIWEKHESGKSEDGQFIVPSQTLKNAYETHQKLDAVVEKDKLDELKESIHDRNKECYRFSINVTKKENEDKGNNCTFFKEQTLNKFWIHWIQNDVERLLKNRITDNLYKLDNSYLKEKVWKSALNYICTKYIAFGKAVYHFMMEDLGKDNGENAEITLGVIPNSGDILSGISSFDYEVIKAHETLQREIEVYVTFAVNNLARATANMNMVDDASDIQLWNEKELQDRVLNPDRTITNILQFFGGRSSWDDGVVKTILEKYLEKQTEKTNISLSTLFLYDLIKIIYSLRNESFHFATKNIDENSWNHSVIAEMFKHDAIVCSTVEKKRFYSNNLPMFYTEDSLSAVLDRLYGKLHSRASQVPAFNRVIPSSKIHSFLTGVDGLKYKQPLTNDGEIIKKWDSACYYLLKEAYYNDFLQSDKSVELFCEALKELRKESDNDEAVADYIKAIYRIVDSKPLKGRVNDIFKALEKIDFHELLKPSKVSLSEICQSIMTEYNLQNNKKRKVDTSNDSVFEDRAYKHYKLFLERTLKEAFKQYIDTESSYEFLKDPKLNDTVQEDMFLTDWKSLMYDDLCNSVSSNADLQKWYILGRFLNAKMLNLLVGSMRSYIQYVEDVNKRAEAKKNIVHKNEENTIERIKAAIPVIEMCIRLSNIFSNGFSDYFDDENDYAKYISQYVDFPVRDEQQPYDSLLSFCANTQSSARIYADAKEPIMNRNILTSKLFGPNLVLAKVIDSTGSRVSKEDITRYADLSKKIENYRKNGECRSVQEQQRVLDYQKLSNRIELRDLAEYGEIINDLLGQLINWNFLRERDLLYFQLGFHYCCLNNDSTKPDRYKTLSLEDRTINNAILHQIAAMYINGVTLYYPKGSQIKNENGKKITVYKASNEVKLKRLSNGTAGLNVPMFTIYSDYVLSGKTEGFYKGNTALYNAGMELFEVISEHKDIIDLRNYIDHFGFYTKKEYSLMDLYSEIFDRFFTYDMKYRKNVPVLLQNIMAKHNVILNVRFDTGRKKSGDQEKDRAQIIITKIESDRFSYSVKDNENKEHILKTDARNRHFLEMIGHILLFSKIDNDCKISISCKPDTEEDENKKVDNVAHAGNRGSEQHHKDYHAGAASKRFNEKGGSKGSPRKYDKEREEGRELLKEYNKKNSGNNDGFGSISGAFANIDMSQFK